MILFRWKIKKANKQPIETGPFGHGDQSERLAAHELSLTHKHRKSSFKML